MSSHTTSAASSNSTQMEVHNPIGTHDSGTSPPAISISSKDDQEHDSLPQDFPSKKTVIPACENIDSMMTPAKLEKLLETIRPGCSLRVPQPGERCHRFRSNQEPPSVVISTAFFKLNLSMPMHSFLTEVLEYYGLAPLQLTPNSYRMAVCMYILYAERIFFPLTARELGYFYQRKETGKKTGYYYLTAWGCHQGRYIKSNKRGMDNGAEHFLYCYGCPSLKKDFNMLPDIPKQIQLDVEELKRAEEALKLCSRLGDGNEL